MIERSISSAEVIERYHQIDEVAVRGLMADCYDILCGDYGESAREQLVGLLGRIYVAECTADGLLS
jgi:hypothetical protein